MSSLELSTGLPEADPPPEFDEFTIVLLMRPAGAVELTEAESERLQRQHLGFLESMRQAGALLLSGPFADQPDENWRGLCVYRLPLEEVQQLASKDPAVQRGRLSVTAFRWLTRKGALVVDSR